MLSSLFLPQKETKWKANDLNESIIPYHLSLRWLGVGLRVQDGFQLGNTKKILGGAVFGIRMTTWISAIFRIGR